MFVTADSIMPDWTDPQMLNRYAYCRNNPLIYTDPSGHVNIFVHGTFASGSHVTDETKLIYSQIFSKNSSELQSSYEFQWTGNNEHKSRLQAAEQLRDAIDNILAKNPKEPINVIAHSHGGNVALQSLKYGSKIDNLVTLGTPVREEYIPGALDNKPKESWINVYSPQDQVQINGGDSMVKTDNQEVGIAGREFNGSVNVPVISDDGPIDTHSLLRHRLGAKIVRSVYDEMNSKP